MEIRFLGSLCIGLGNIAVLGHLVQYDALAVLGRFQAPEGGVVVRAVRKPGQHGTLGQGEVFHVFAEVHLGRCLDAVASLAEVNLVHVHFQDLFLGVLVFNLQGQYHFQQFSLQGLFLGEEGISCQLLGDGGTALAGGVVGNHIGPYGAENAPGVYAVMLIEAHIFCCHKGILQVLRNLGDRHGDAVFLCMHRGNEPSLVIIDAGGSVRLDIGRHVRQVPGYGHKEPRRRTGSGNHHDDQQEDKNPLEKGGFLLRPLATDIRIFHI